MALKKIQYLAAIAAAALSACNQGPSKTVDYFLLHPDERLAKITVCTQSADTAAEIECQNAINAEIRSGGGGKPVQTNSPKK